MGPKAYLSYSAAVILQAVASGYKYGFDVMDMTGLPSGTVYPALRRLEETGFVRSEWEEERIAQTEQRPARKYYEVTGAGRDALSEAVKRFRYLDRLLPQNRPEDEPV
ncbi:MAG TPA: PadR family transcriptional regulator [Blastocatellia bacterium]|nr:PadR family transcriptional regulator [Blastocatellia bacterium]